MPETVRTSRQWHIVVATVVTVAIMVGAVGLVALRQTNGRLTTVDVIDPAASAAGGENILLVGLDSRTDAEGNPLPAAVLSHLHAGTTLAGSDNTDTMIVVHVPAGGSSATAISIPRDSYVALAGGFGTHKINSAYAYGRNAAAKQLQVQGVGGPALEVQAGAAGAQTAIGTVEQLTGLPITHYAAVNMAGFADIAQAVGGVPVCLDAAVDDPASGADFPAGPQTLDGVQSLEFVRQRHGLPGGDLDRIRRQQAFLASVAHTVLSAGTLTDPARLTNLLDAVQRSVTIDAVWDLLSFAEQVRKLSSGDIRFETIPVVSTSLRTGSDGEAVQVDPAQVQAFVRAAVVPGGASAVPIVADGVTCVH